MTIGKVVYLHLDTQLSAGFALLEFCMIGEVFELSCISESLKKGFDAKDPLRSLNKNKNIWALRALLICTFRGGKMIKMQFCCQVVWCIAVP